MSIEYGYRIMIFQAASVYEYNNGQRQYMDYKQAMLTNSLFKEYLDSIGLKVSSSGSTRDIICLDFGYGSKSFERKAYATKDKAERKEYLEKAKEYDKTKEQLRISYYLDGIDITQGGAKKQNTNQETIHYKMLFRSTNKAKQGKCMFIRDSLYEQAANYLRMGITIPEKNAPIVELSAYQSLIASTIVGKVQINPKDILILEDFDSKFQCNVISVMTDENKQCYAERKSDYVLTNTMFDGQALIDSSIFPDQGDGYILLREHFCKMAAFNTHIQKYFKDYYGDSYDTATINDYQGNPHKVSDIKLITTVNSCKQLKFNISYDYWCEWVNKNDNQFGIVKTSHKSKLGEHQVMSYQMVNSLDIDTMADALLTSQQYIENLKTDESTYLQFLRDNSNFSNDFEVLLALVEYDRDFIQSEYFKKRKQDIINAYIKYIKTGKLLQNGDNLTIVGNPYGMLMQAVGLNPEDDPTFEQEADCTQCYTGRFKDGDYLAAFRSPYNSRNNMNYLHNHYHEYFDKYFSLGKQIICVNLKHTDFQHKNNGSDQDSDSLYVTDTPVIVNHAKYCYANYPTIVNQIPQEKNHYDGTLLSFATIDNKLAASQLSIGESSNLAQICLSYSYNSEQLRGISAEQCYLNVCILSVVAQVAIDNAKRSYDIDLMSEIKRIKSEMHIELNKLPKFQKTIKEKNELRRLDISKQKDKVKQRADKANEFYLLKQRMAEEELRYCDLTEEERAFYDKMDIYNLKLKCPMNEIYDLKINSRIPSSKTYPMSKFYVKFTEKPNYRKSRKVEQLIEEYSLELYKYNTGNTGSDPEQYLLLDDRFDELVEDIKKVYISNNYIDLMSYLIDRAFFISPAMKSNKEISLSKLKKNRSLLLKVLFSVNCEAFLKCFGKNRAENLNKINEL